MGYLIQPNDGKSADKTPAGKSTGAERRELMELLHNRNVLIGGGALVAVVVIGLVVSAIMNGNSGGTASTGTSGNAVAIPGGSPGAGGAPGSAGVAPVAYPGATAGAAARSSMPSGTGNGPSVGGPPSDSIPPAPTINTGGGSGASVTTYSGVAPPAAPSGTSGSFQYGPRPPVTVRDPATGQTHTFHPREEPD